jgi:SAM-dependent methyltransferase
MSAVGSRDPAGAAVGRDSGSPRSARGRTNATRRYFDRRADAFDQHYGGAVGLMPLRHGPQRTREVAVSVVSQYDEPAVLDLGCGPGRVAEAVLAAGAASYVGVDISTNMLELAHARLAGHESAELLAGDFIDLDIPRTFDIVLALGLFEYLEQPDRAAAWMHARCGSTLVASFTSWDWVKGPVRHAHYLVHRCPISDFTEAEGTALLARAGFSRVEFLRRGRRGFVVSAMP